MKHLLSLSFYAYLHQVPTTKKGSEIKPSLLLNLSMTPSMLGLRAMREWEQVLEVHRKLHAF